MIDAKLASVAMPQDEVLARVAEIAAADMGDFLEFDEAGKCSISVARGRSRGKLYALRRVRTRGGEVEIELENKLAALIKLGEYYGMWNREQAAGLTMAALAGMVKERLEIEGGP